MKRVLLSITGTVAGLAALLSFKAQGHPLTTAGGLPSASLPSGTTSAAPSTGTSSAGASKSTGASKAAPSTTTSSAAATRTVAGSVVNTQYGVVQVEVTASGKKIQNVQFLQLTAYDGRSQEINSQAAPILLQETLTAQSSSIDTVSGATYTSAGYVQSLQAALDQLGIP